MPACKAISIYDFTLKILRRKDMAYQLTTRKICEKMILVFIENSAIFPKH
jgi:hypothetical protein